MFKSGGRFFISDLRRDMAFPVRWFHYFGTKPKERRPGLLTSIDASYTPKELAGFLKLTPLEGAKIGANPIGLEITEGKA
ncbi:hypothetical protein JW906_04080 [bacterium]|nr:hypothetical protein [bacterium]